MVRLTYIPSRGSPKKTLCKALVIYWTKHKLVKNSIFQIKQIFEGENRYWDHETAGLGVQCIELQYTHGSTLMHRPR